MAAVAERPLLHRASLVTGASRGIGKGIALCLAEAGADLLLSARSMDDLEQTAAECRAHGVRAETIHMDAYDLDQVDAAVDAVTERFGRIDVLVNNAGGSRNVDGGWLGFMESNPRIVRELFELNVFSPYFAAQRAARAMERQGGGCIINITSPLADYPSARIQPYSVAKMAIQEFTKLWAAELGPKGIRVNAIAPGSDHVGADREGHGGEPRSRAWMPRFRSAASANPPTSARPSSSWPATPPSGSPAPPC